MLNNLQLEQRLSANYPLHLSKVTQKKRQENIDALWAVIDTAKREHDIKYGFCEERLVLYRTASAEEISIQYPGKESGLDGAKECPYDFRPKIVTADGMVLRDLVFADMWSLVEKINEDHHSMLKILATLFFKLGRMTSHKTISENYNYVILNNSNEIEDSGLRLFTWNKLCIDADVIESLNFAIPEIEMTPIVKFHSKHSFIFLT